MKEDEAQKAAHRQSTNHNESQRMSLANLPRDGTKMYQGLQRQALPRSHQRGDCAQLRKPLP